MTTSPNGPSGTTHMAGDDERCIADGEPWPCSLTQRIVDFAEIETDDE